MQRWQQLSALDPLSSRGATGLLEALRDAGDSTAALQFARRYEALVAQELDTGVGATVESLVASIRDAVPHGATPHQSERSPAADVAPIVTPAPRPRRRPARYVIGGVLTLSAIAGTVLWRSRSEPHPAPPEDVRPSIAVLPLTNVSGRPQDAALVDGLTEELIGMLARTGTVRVIGRTSAFALKGSGAATRRIADSLGVSNILEGRAQHDGTRLRVQVRLLSVADGTTRWAQTYDRELTDIFTVQSEIAGEVARALDVRLRARELPRPAASLRMP